MSELVMNDQAPSDAGAQASGGTAGAMLKEARVQAGLHVAALAVALKVPVYKIEALESGRLDIFPDAVFVRALAASICRTLKVDSAPILALLPQSHPPRLVADKGINATFKDASARSGGGVVHSSGSSSRFVVIAVVLLLFGVVMLVWAPRGWDLFASRGDMAAPMGESPQGEVTAPELQSPAALAAPDTVGVAASSVVGAPPEAASAVAPASVMNAPVQATNASAPVVVDDAAPPDEGVLVIRARSESWVQVRSLTSGASVQRQLNQGESLVAPGVSPWAVVVGKADGTDVLVRGKVMDLSAIARENVARFEVK